MATIPTDFDQLAHAIAFATVHSDIEVYAARVTVDGHEYWDTTRPRHDSETPAEDLAYLQRAMSYIDKAGDVFPQRMLRHIAAPGLVRFVDRDSKTAADGACYCQQGVVCPACERAAPPPAPVGQDKPTLWKLLRKNHLTGDWVDDAGERWGVGEVPQELADSVAAHPDDYRLKFAYERPAPPSAPVGQEPVATIHSDGYWTHEPGKDPFDRFGQNANSTGMPVFATAPPAAPAASIQILIEWLFRRFGAPIDAGELPNPVVTAVREVERWLNPLLPMPEAPR